MFFYFNFLNSNESLCYTLIKVRLNYISGSHFRSKISIWSFYLFFISIWSLCWEVWCNQVLSDSGVITVLNGVPCVSSWVFLKLFLNLFIYFLIFLKKLQNCHVSSWHRATCQADTVPHVTIMPGVISFLYSQIGLSILIFVSI